MTTNGSGKGGPNEEFICGRREPDLGADVEFDGQAWVAIEVRRASAVPNLEVLDRRFEAEPPRRRAA